MAAIAAEPALATDSSDLHLLGLQRHRQGRTAEAITLIRRAIALAPTRAFLHSNLSHLLCERGDWTGAIDAADKAIGLEPDLPEAHLHRGNALQAMGNFAGTIASFRQVIRLRPADARGHGNLANALQATGQVELAIESHRRAVGLDPSNAQLVSNFATALVARGELDAAITLHRRAQQLAPRDARILSNLGQALFRGGRFEEAEIAQRGAISIASDLPQAHVNLGMLRMMRGDWNAAWEEYEWRWRDSARFVDARRAWPKQRWNGSALNGRTVLLHAEQGFGDTIQFLRYVPEVVRRGGRVIVEVAAGLRRLMESSQLGQIKMIERQGLKLPAVDFDVQLPLGSLPLVLGQADPGESVRGAYLAADVGLRGGWRRRLAGLKGGKIGVVWAGSAGHGDDRWRSIAAEALGPLGSVAASFVSLQVKSREAAPVWMANWTEHLRDWADTAALVAELDGVIAVDTAVAHLAGALGKAVWILLPRICDARWQASGERSAWYPRARLFRQRDEHGWGEVIERVRTELIAKGM